MAKSERTADLVELQVYFDPPLPYSQAVTQAEAIRASIARSGWNVAVVDIRGEDDVELADE